MNFAVFLILSSLSC